MFNWLQLQEIPLLNGSPLNPNYINGFLLSPERYRQYLLLQYNTGGAMNGMNGMNAMNGRLPKYPASQRSRSYPYSRPSSSIADTTVQPLPITTFNQLADKYVGSTNGIHTPDKLPFTKEWLKQIYDYICSKDDT